MIASLARVPALRIARRPRVLAGAGAWVAVAIAVAVVVRSVAYAHAADAALRGGFGAVAMPFLVYGLVGGALGGGGLARSGRPLVAFGASPASAALAPIAVAVVTSAVVSSLLAAIVAVVAHGAGDPPAARDALTSAYAGALGGAAYASYFALGASFGARGQGRVAFLALDLVFGSGTGALALFFPRAHVTSLLGGAAVLGASGRVSAIALALLAAVLAGLAVLRARRG